MQWEQFYRELCLKEPYYRPHELAEMPLPVLWAMFMQGGIGDGGWKSVGKGGLAEEFARRRKRKEGG